MALATQQTQLYAIDPTSQTVLTVGGVTDVSGIDAPISAIDVTDLGSDTRTFVPGVKEPAAATFTINFDPQDESQATLHQLRDQRKTLKWALGFSDGAVTPTADSGGDGFAQSAVGRTFIYFEGFLTAFPFSANVNDKVTSQIGVQLTVSPALVKKTGA